MRENWLSNRVFTSYDNIIDHCCEAWNKVVDQPWRIMTIGRRKWAHGCRLVVDLADVEGAAADLEALPPSPRSLQGSRDEWAPACIANAGPNSSNARDNARVPIS